MLFSGNRLNVIDAARSSVPSLTGSAALGAGETFGNLCAGASERGEPIAPCPAARGHLGSPLEKAAPFDGYWTERELAGDRPPIALVPRPCRDGGGSARA